MKNNFKDDVKLLKEILLLANGYPYIPKSLALALSLAKTYNARLTALYIINSNWDEILGDEWISDYRTLKEFYRYYEDELRKEASAHLKEIRKKGAAHNVPVHTAIKKGLPPKVIVSAGSASGPAGLLIIPAPYRHSADTLNINPGDIAKQITCPLLTVKESKEHQNNQ